MTLLEYIELAHKEIEDFKNHYLEQYAENKANYPLDQDDEIEWEEQLAAYKSLQ